MKPIGFLSFLAVSLGMGGAAHHSDFGKLPAKPRERRNFRRERDHVTTSIYGRRWTWNTPHLGAKQAAKLERRAVIDAKAAASNYPGWRGKNKTFSQP